MPRTTYSVTKTILVTSFLAGSCLVAGSASANDEESLDSWMKKTTGDQGSEPVATQDTEASSAVKGTVELDPEDGDDGTNMYFRFNAGANMLADVKIDDISQIYRFFPTYEFVLSDMKLSYDTGIDLNLALGFDISDSWSVEIFTGVAKNDVSGVSATYFDSFYVNPFFQVSGGSGDITQIPIMANFRYGIGVSDALEIGISAGVGAQYSDFTVKDLRIGQNGITTAPLGVSVSGSAWAARVQLGLDLEWNLADNISLGLYARYAATSETDFGYVDGSTAQVKAESFQNIAIGGSFGIAF